METKSEMKKRIAAAAAWKKVCDREIECMADVIDKIVEDRPKSEAAALALVVAGFGFKD